MTADVEEGGRGWASEDRIAQPVRAGRREAGRPDRRPSAGGAFSGLGRISPLAVGGIGILTVASLYLARAVLIPVALAVLLTFLVHPVVSFLSRAGLGRVPSVVLVVFLLFSALGGVSYAVALQFGGLSEGISRYRDNLIAKIAVVRSFRRGGALERAQTAVSAVKQELEKEADPPKPHQTPTPVIVRSEESFLRLPSLLEGLGSAAIVVVLVIFMLLEREELRNRFLRLVGYGRLTIATRALDEASQRISRYLLMHTVINASGGLVVAVGLLAIGVPYALLWGFLTGVLRFIPYVGAWLAAAVLVAFCLAAFPGWWPAVLAIGLFVAVELVCYVVLEPLLYGQSAGVSQVALLISISFWTWLWGPVGLLLATPLTVCLLVLAKHVPELEFLTVLMADQPPLAPPVTYYQRLLAGDRDEADAIVGAYLKTHSLEAVYDDVVLPALGHARRDRQRRRLSAADEQGIWEATREIVEDLATRREPAPGGSAGSGAVPAADATALTRRVRLLVCPAHDEGDEVATSMLRQLLDPASWAVDVASPHLLTSEVVALVEAAQPAALCIAAGHSGAPVFQSRHLCKRLRARFGDLKIVVGLWGLSAEQVGPARRRLREAGADLVGTSLRETRHHLDVLHGLDPRPAAPAPGPAPEPIETSAARREAFT